MTTLYFRSIFANLLKIFLVVVGSLTSIVWLTQTLRMLDLIVSKGVGFSLVLGLTTLMVPSLLAVIMPPSLFIAVLVVYHRLMVDHELVVWRSTGMHNLKIARPAIVFSLLVVLIGYGLSLYVVPVSYRHFKDRQVFIRDHYASLLLQDNTFSTPVPGLTIYTHDHNAKGELEGIVIHDGRVKNRQVTMTAKSGKISKQEGKTVFELENGTRQEFDPRSKALKMLYFDHYPLDISLYTRGMNERSRQTEEYFLHELFSSEIAADANHYPRLRAEGHQRLSWPWYNFILTILALTALLLAHYNRRGQVVRLIVTSISALFVLILAIGMQSLTLSFPLLWPLMYLPPLLFGGVFMWKLYG
jgi:lipopolysaccharide export system permease protein